MTTDEQTTDEVMMQRFGKVLLIGIIGFATACVVTGAAVSMLLH
jgi:hypothetical protein